MEEMIKYAEQLHDCLCGLNRLNNYHRRKWLEKGVIVSTRIRQQYLCSIHQGQLIIGGEVVKVNFESIGGGCWKVGIKRLNGSDYFEVCND